LFHVSELTRSLGTFSAFVTTLSVASFVAIAFTRKTEDTFVIIGVFLLSIIVAVVSRRSKYLSNDVAAPNNSRPTPNVTKKVWAKLQDEAGKTFGDYEFARQWLLLPNPALKNKSPLEVAETDTGIREVEAVLSRIAHGDYS
jgi:hypothetical protein